jgi:DNA-binding NarL/FixJ family response regulator
VVVDIRMPPAGTTEGLGAARVIREELPKTGILVLSAFVEADHAMDLIANGPGVGYLLKSRVADVDDFIDAVQRIAHENQVLALMAEGRSNAGLWLAEATVEKHVRNIMTKLDHAQTDDDHRRVRAVITYLEAS